MPTETSHDLHLHRVLRAPRAAVWACWTDPAHIPHWFAPEPVVTRVVAFDLRPGGAFDIAMTMDGQEFPHEPGCFLEVVEGERLTWTSALGPDYRPVDPAAAPFLFTATITLADAPDGATDYRVVARHKDASAAQAHEEMGFSQGWGTVADQLGAYAAGLGR